MVGKKNILNSPRLISGFSLVAHCIEAVLMQTENTSMNPTCNKLIVSRCCIIYCYLENQKILSRVNTIFRNRNLSGRYFSHCGFLSFSY